MRSFKVLVVEDSEPKYQDLQRILIANVPSATITRVSTVLDAENVLSDPEVDLIILDISMDITATKLGLKKGGHATLGGLELLQRAYLLGFEKRTIIVTAFDSFESNAMERTGYIALGLEDVKSSACKLLGQNLIGCVRYGQPDWERELDSMLEKALS